MNDADPQPPSSAVAVSRDGETLVIEMLPTGMNPQNRRAMRWYVMLVVLGAIAVAITSTANMLPGATIGVACIFVGIGLAGLLKLWLRARRAAVVRIGDDALSIVWRDVWSYENDTWTRDELAEVEAPRTDLNMDDGATRELEVVRKTGHTVRLMHGRPREELQWLAQLIREQYDVRPRRERQP